MLVSIGAVVFDRPYFLVQDGSRFGLRQQKNHMEGGSTMWLFG
jgi:hypothetical protein